MLTKETLDSVLAYEPATGLFRYLKKRGAMKPGDIAGTKGKHGHVRINVLGTLHYAHRLAWLTTYGEMPKGVIDHIDGNPSDNRLCNLRDVCHAENLQNQFRPLGRNPYLGVSLVNGRWNAAAMRFGLSVNLGRFDTPEAASAAYQACKLMSHEEFARLARSRRRKNKLTAELSQVLSEFPGFDADETLRAAWLKRREQALL